MREWCSCGASIRARRSDVLAWRHDHNHPGVEPEREPERQGAHAQVELANSIPLDAYAETYSPTINARIIGFTRE